MDLATIDMPKEEAQKAFEEYRAAVRERHDAEDEQIMRGYKELAEGRQLVRLSECVAAGGEEHTRRFDSASYFLPRIALVRADLPWTYCQGVNQNGSVTFYGNENMNPYATRLNSRVPAGTFPANNARSTNWRPWRAMTPKIPPALRPAGSLKRFHILFEAKWDATAPRDPALLRHIGGDLYAVLAVWDLTDLERAVLAGRAQA
jgi:hypothetical protein